MLSGAGGRKGSQVVLHSARSWAAQNELALKIHLGSGKQLFPPYTAVTGQEHLVTAGTESIPSCLTGGGSQRQAGF